MLTRKFLNRLFVILMLVSLATEWKRACAPADHGTRHARESDRRDEGSPLLWPLSELGQQPVHARLTSP